jgi:hypothetical protein
MIDYVAALVGLVPDAKISYAGVNPDYSTIVWQDDRPQPTREECENAWPDIKAANETATAKNSRANAYRNEADPLFFGWQRDENPEQEWLDKVQEIRDRFPYSV